MEILLRVHEVRPLSLPLPDFGPEPSEHTEPGPTEETPPTGMENQDGVTLKTTIPAREVPGHTGYLTFATKPRT